MPETPAEARRRLRADMLARRRQLPAEERLQLDERIAGHLDTLLDELGIGSLAVYWPIRGEPDLRSAWARWHARGIELALPVVAERAAPLVFRRYTPGDALGRDVLGIPAPLDAPLIAPAALLAPFVAVDLAGFRLGNGGGYFDRTLAALQARPLCIGVGYACCDIDSIAPQPHDEALDRVVTEAGIREITAPRRAAAPARNNS